ncbi:restriction endonuclease subunit S [Clostridium manihotivorum]|uniref:Type I restriction modification DNA specificity domain-containing protein n=1 Tax=Clostridium manihotivorum TaxID=2320868 RepID=A0A3R5QSI3_9CLOT|nr:restriction endonuclease subunit S [Clostridium manihotivorum]QAA31314.1 hypothetical protein C1I91_06475 [Clostridium manihotivorum]
MSFKVSDICNINKNNLSAKDNLSFINYLDTSNLNEGVIDNLQKLIIGEDTIPSRAKRKVEKDDILISTVRPNQKHYGIIKKIEENLIASTGFVVLSAKEDVVDAEYLYRFLTQEAVTEYLQAVGETSTSTYPSIKPSDIGGLEIELPALEEQKAIAKIFSDLDEKIETNNQINKRLEEMAQTIFKQWFVDFDFPNEDGEPYKSSGGEMVESEMGMIPRGWEVESLDKIANYLNGLAMQKYRPSEDEDGYPVLKIKELRQGNTDSSSDLCSYEIPNQYIIEDGDVIFSWSGSLLVDIWCGGTCGLNQHLFKVTSNEYDKWFYYFWTKLYLDKFIRIAESKATTMGHIKRQDLANSLIVLPSKGIYRNANIILKPILDKIIDGRVESRKLSELRGELLPKLMSGDIRVTLE